MYYLMMAALLCFFVGEYAFSPLSPPALTPKSGLRGWLLGFLAMVLVHFLVLWLTLGYWGILLAAALIVFHIFVDLLTGLLYGAVSGRRVLLTLLDLTLHIICMYAAAVLVSLFGPEISYRGSIFLRYGAMAATAMLLFPALSKTLLVDGFPRFYSERQLFTLPEWLMDAVCGLLVGLCCLLLPSWWLAVGASVFLMIGYFVISERMEPGRPVLALSKIGVLLLLMPCFLLIFRL